MVHALASEPLKVTLAGARHSMFNILTLTLTLTLTPAPTPSLTLTRRLLGAEVRDQVRDEAGEREQGLRQDDGGVSSVRWFVRRWGNY